MREMEGPAPGGCVDGSYDEGLRGASANLHDLFKGAGRCSGTQGATGRAFAAHGARSGTTRGFPSGGACRKWSEPRATVAGMDAGWSNGSDSRGAGNWSDVVPESSENGSGGRTCRRAEAGGMASSQRCSAGDAGARDFGHDAET